MHQQHKERREARHGRGGHNRDDDGYDNSNNNNNNYGSQQQQQHNRPPYQGGDNDDEPRRPPYSSQSQAQGQGQGRGYAPPSGPPTVGHGSLGGLDRGDFASDADIDRMVASGEFDGRRGQGQGYGGSNLEHQNAYARHDVPAG